jgi:two-component sensor histidine kinase
MPRRLTTRTQRTRRWPLWARLLATAAVVLTAFGLRGVLLGPGPGYPYLLAFPAVIVCGLAFGRGSAFLAVALSALLGGLLFVAPTDDLYVSDPRDAVALVLFLAIGTVIAAIVEDLHAAVHEATEVNQRLAAAEAGQRVLRREAAHRRQNDLQRLISTLRLQAQASRDEAVRAALDEAIGRVQALARVDQGFERGGDGHGAVDTRDLLTGLIADLRQSGGAELRPIAFEVLAEAHEVSREQAVSLGLVATELVGNALKYAFPEERAGTVSVGFRREGEHFVLIVADDGVGFDPAAPPRGTGLGGRLVRALAAQLGGRVEVQSGGDARGGTTCTVRFPARAAEAAATTWRPSATPPTGAEPLAVGAP